MNDHRISRRSFLAAAGMAGAAAALTACGGAASSAASSVASSAAASSEAAQSVELIVFAAASLTETLNAIGESYTAEHPEVTFRFNFDSSGTLKTQIQEGADCDLFISAGQKQMNQLDITASADVNEDGLDFVDADSRVNLLENKVVLCVPEGSDKGIDSFDALAEHLKAQDILFCMGNSDVPVGQYTQKILTYYQLDSTASAEGNTEGLDFVDAESRVDLLENKVVLCVPEGSDKGIDSFDSLAEHLKAEDILFCMGNSDVPVGQYTQKILAYYDLDEAALAAAGVITYGSNVKEVTTQVSEASVDAGVVYCTDAYSAGLTPVDEATKEMCGQVIYPAAVMKNALHAEAAKEFLAYLRTDKAATVFESVGFTAL